MKVEDVYKEMNVNKIEIDCKVLLIFIYFSVSRYLI